MVPVGVLLVYEYSIFAFGVELSVVAAFVGNTIHPNNIHSVQSIAIHRFIKGTPFLSVMTLS